MQSSLSAYKTVNSAQHSPTQQIDVARSNAISGVFVLLLPTVIVCVFVGYRKYKAKVLQHRIHRLNRLWQLDCSQKLS